MAKHDRPPAISGGGMFASGLDVAARVLADTPGQCIILFSAYLDDDVRRRANEIGIRACVPKSDVNRLPAVIAALASD